MVEPQPSKLKTRVRSPSPALVEPDKVKTKGGRRRDTTGDVRHQEKLAAVAQLVERVLGKDEVMGSSPISSSFLNCPPTATVLVRLFPDDPGKMFQVSRETMFRQVFTHAGILVQK